jgi:hypothetical protein
MLTFLPIYGLLIATVALVMAFARTGPDEAKSKLSEWAEFFGLMAASRWLARHALDRRVLKYGAGIMFVLVFVGGIAVGMWIQSKQSQDVAADQLENAISPVRKERDTALSQLNEFKQENARLRNRPEAPTTQPVRPSTAGPVVPQQDAPALPTTSLRTIQSLSSSERDSLSRELYKLKSLIPEIWLTESLVGPPSHDRAVFSGIFFKAGIRAATTQQELEGPDQAGLLLCVPDVNLIPEKVKKLAEVLRNFGIETNYAPLVQSKISSTVPPEIGFVLFVGPKP